MTSDSSSVAFVQEYVSSRRAELQYLVSENCPFLKLRKSYFLPLWDEFNANKSDERNKEIVHLFGRNHVHHLAYWEYQLCHTKKYLVRTYKTLGWMTSSLIAQIEEELQIDLWAPNSLFDEHCDELRRCAEEVFLGCQSEIQECKERLPLFDTYVTPCLCCGIDVKKCTKIPNIKYLESIAISTEPILNEEEIKKLFLASELKFRLHPVDALTFAIDVNSKWVSQSNDDLWCQYTLTLLSVAYYALYMQWVDQDQGEVLDELYMKSITCAFIAMSRSRNYLIRKPWNQHISEDALQCSVLTLQNFIVHLGEIETGGFTAHKRKLIHNRAYSLAKLRSSSTAVGNCVFTSIKMDLKDHSVSSYSQIKEDCEQYITDLTEDQCATDIRPDILESSPTLCTCIYHKDITKIVLADLNYTLGINEALFSDDSVTTLLYFEKAITLYREVNDNGSVAMCLLQLAKQYEYGMRDIQRADLLFQELLEFSNSHLNTMTIQYAIVEYFYGAIYCCRMNMWKNVQSHMQNCLKTCYKFSQAEPLHIKTEALKIKAQASFMLGNVTTSLRYYRNAVNNLCNKTFYRERYRLFALYGLLLNSQNKSKQAMEAWEKAYIEHEKMVEYDYSFEIQGSACSDDKWIGWLIRAMMLGYLRNGEIEKSLDIFDMCKANVLVQKLEHSNEKNMETKSDSKTQYKNNAYFLKQMATDLDSLIIVFCNCSENEWDDNIFNEALSYKRNLLLVWIIDKNLQNLKVLYFVTHGKDYNFYELTDMSEIDNEMERITSEFVPTEAFSVEKDIYVQNRAVRFVGERNGKENVSTKPFLKNFFHKYISQDQAKSIIIVPDGKFYSEKFSSIEFGDSKEMLVQHFGINIVPSLRYIYAARRNKWNFVLNPKMIIFANPKPVLQMAPICPNLKFAEDEAERIANYFPNTTVVYKNETATKTAIRLSLDKGANIIHFATHGFINLKLSGDGNDTETGIMVSAEDESSTSQKDCLLNIFEIKLFDMSQVELVVLNCCYSGSGNVSKSEGFLGLGRAFLFAGCRAVLLNNSYIIDSDKTIRFMEFFYQDYSRNRSASKAMKFAVEKIINLGYPATDWDNYYVLGQGW